MRLVGRFLFVLQCFGFTTGNEISNLANIFVKSEFRCAGVHYQSGLVLTTATHLFSPQIQVSLYGGSDLAMRDASKRWEVKAIHFHPEYNFNFPSFNLAALHLDFDVPGTRNDLPSLNIGKPSGSVLLVGWEARAAVGDESYEVFSSTPMEIVKSCPTVIRPNLTPGEACATTPELNTIFVADGSPLISNSDNFNQVLALYSRSNSYEHQHLQAELVFVTIEPYQDWIQEVSNSIRIDEEI